LQALINNKYKQIRLRYNLTLSVVLSIFYATVIVLLPWELISKDGFPDFENYKLNFEYYIASGTSYVELYDLSSIIQYFTREVMWYKIIYALHELTDDVVTSLRSVSFFIAFIFCLFLLRKVGFKYSLLFLINPSVIDVAMSGIRNGLAWVLIVIAFWARSEIIKLVLFVVAIFIHSTSLVLFLLYYLTRTAAHYFKGRTLLIIGIAAGLGVGFALTVLNEMVLGVIGDRRSGLEYLVGGGSFKLASIWVLLILLQCTSGSEYIKKNIFAISVIAWYHVMNQYIPGSYRIWAALMPIIALSIMDLPIKRRSLFILLYICYMGMQYFYWSKLYFLFY
jgi:hypothetical protein